MNEPVACKGLGPRLRGESGSRGRKQAPHLNPRPSDPAVFPTQAGIQTLALRRDVARRMEAFAGRSEVGVGLKPPPPASLRGVKRRSNLGDHQLTSVSAPWVASLRSQ